MADEPEKSSFQLSAEERRSLEAVAREQPDTRFGRRARGLLALSEVGSPWVAAERVGVRVETLARWRDLYEQERCPAAVRCQSRRGRYAVLRARAEPILQCLPAVFGYQASEWTPALLRLHLASAEGVVVPVDVLERWLRDGFTIGRRSASEGLTD